MRGSWTIVVDPADPSQMLIRRGSASVNNIGGFTLEDLDWVRLRLREKEAFEANLKADPFEPVEVDPLIDELRRRREAQGLTYADVATPMGSASTRIKSAEEGRVEPKWSNLKLWAYLLGCDIVLKERQ